MQHMVVRNVMRELQYSYLLVAKMSCEIYVRVTVHLFTSALIGILTNSGTTMQWLMVMAVLGEETTILVPP